MTAAWQHLLQQESFESDTMKCTVAVAESDNKIEALDKVIEKSQFLKDLENSLKKSGKSREEFSIAVKPNIMMLYHREHLHVATDSELVEHLARRTREEGYEKVAIVESRNLYTDWFPKRTVRLVAEVAGYTFSGYNLVDLTEDAEPYDYGGDLGKDFVGKSWKNADYRISFQKNKTHIICTYTLSMKNMFGTLPCQSKYARYHETVGWEKATIDVLRNFPPDFAFIDAFWSSDSMNGCVLERPKYTKTIIGGRNFVAVDWVGALKMGLDPLENPLMKMAVDLFGKPEFEVDGSIEPYKNWKNSSMTIGRMMSALEHLGITSSVYHLLFMLLMDPAFK